MLTDTAYPMFRTAVLKSIASAISELQGIEVLATCERADAVADRAENVRLMLEDIQELVQRHF